MDKTNAIVMWNDCAWRNMGMDQDGNESSQLTGFGGFVIGMGASSSLWEGNPDKTSHKQAAGVLRRWANALAAPDFDTSKIIVYASEFQQESGVEVQQEHIDFANHIVCKIKERWYEAE